MTWWEILVDQLQEFLSHICCYIHTKRGVEPGDSSGPVLLFLVWLARSRVEGELVAVPASFQFSLIGWGQISKNPGSWDLGSQTFL